VWFDERKTARVPDLDVDAARRLQEYRDSIRKLEAVSGSEELALSHQFRDLATLVTSSGRAEVRRRDAKPSLIKTVDGTSMGEVATVFVANPELDLAIRKRRRAVWSEADKELFEKALGKHGRNFWLVSLEFGTQHPGKKSFADCVEYFYLHKFQLKWVWRVAW
jgi:hypothetical protein